MLVTKTMIASSYDEKLQMLKLDPNVDSLIQGVHGQWVS